MSKGNSKDFCRIVDEYTERDVERYSNISKDTILTSRYYDGNFVADYRRPIEHYLKACGCKILSTNNNWWDDRFYVYHTVPTKAVDPVTWFDEDYKDGIYWSNNKKGLSILCGGALILFIVLFVVTTVFSKL